MKRFPLVLLAALWALSAGGGRLLAWGDFGHEMVALVAWGELGPQQRAAVSAILGGNPEIFGTGTGTAPLLVGATWPDKVRFEARMSTPNVPLAIFGSLGITMSHQSNNLHFVDYKGAKPALPNGQSAIVAITLAEEVLRDPSSPLRSKGEALTFLIHCVGDIHQPLHAGNAGDKGGNGIAIDGIGRSVAKTELHAVWDSGLFKTTKVKDPEAYIAEFLRGPLAEARAQATLDLVPADWAAASHQLALTQAYVDENGRTIAPGDHLSAAYVASRLKVANQQIARAGVRLAALLKGDFP